jgi:hypothetical protein
LYPGALLLILDELAQLLLVLVRERAEVGLVDRGVVHFFSFSFSEVAILEAAWFYVLGGVVCGIEVVAFIRTKLSVEVGRP